MTATSPPTLAPPSSDAATGTHAEPAAPAPATQPLVAPSLPDVQSVSAPPVSAPPAPEPVPTDDLPPPPPGAMPASDDDTAPLRARSQRFYAAVVIGLLVFSMLGIARSTIFSDEPGIAVGNGAVLADAAAPQLAPDDDAADLSAPAPAPPPVMAERDLVSEPVVAGVGLDPACEVESRMLSTAVEAFETLNGVPPAAADELVGGFIREVPVQWYFVAATPDTRAHFAPVPTGACDPG